MAKVSLRGLKKIYPHAKRENKKAKKIARERRQEELQEREKVKDRAAPGQLTVTAEGVVAVHDFNLDIDDEEFIVLVGPSGCGKSTTLRMIAGLEEITAGELYIDDKLVNEIPPKDRDIAMVFQSYALYPHMTVYENMAFGLELRKVPREEIDRRVREAASILDITQYLDRLPKALSGGQRQRVAIGRAIVRDPKVFLMDEPLSNLDAKLRNQMRAEIIQLRRRIKTTFVYVTHDQTEAMTLGDRIVIMKDGYIQQVGTPQEVFDHPKNLFVAAFIGSPQMNFFPGQIEKSNERYQLQLAGQTFSLSDSLSAALLARETSAQPIQVGIRPEHITLADPSEPGPKVEGFVELSEMMGSSMHLHLLIDEAPVVVEVKTVDLPPAYRQGLKPGDLVSIKLNTDLVHLFDAAEQNLIYA